LNKSRSDTLNTLNQDSTVRTVGIQLNIPIYSGGYVYAATSQAVSNFEKAKSDLDTRISQVLVEIGKQHSLVLSSASKIDALVKSVNSAKLVVTATEQSIKGGVRINLDLLNAQQNLFAAKRDLALARYNYLLSYLRLRSAAGTLTTDDVRTVAGYFVPGSSYDPAAQAATPKSMAAHLSTQAAQTVHADAPVSAVGTSKPEAKKKASADEDLRNLLAAWTKAWSARDVKTYLGFYANDFKPGDGLSHEAWAQERAARIQRHARISVKSESPEIAMDGDRATMKFRQIYKSDRLADDSRKTLVLAKQDGVWKITSERSE
jgi:protease secretion system outer membrane protein